MYWRLCLFKPLGHICHVPERRAEEDRVALKSRGAGYLWSCSPLWVSCCRAGPGCSSGWSCCSWAGCRESWRPQVHSGSCQENFLACRERAQAHTLNAMATRWCLAHMARCRVRAGILQGGLTLLVGKYSICHSQGAQVTVLIVSR